MKLSSTLLLLALAAETTVASSWFGTKAGMYQFENLQLIEAYSLALLTACVVYNKWHETELERWLSDHNIPYPTPADRKDLESTVKANWNSKVGQPYNDWSPSQLQSYLKSKGADAKKSSDSNTQSLIKQVKGYWTESADSGSNAYGSVKDWIFDRFALSKLS